MASILRFRYCYSQIFFNEFEQLPETLFWLNTLLFFQDIPIVTNVLQKIPNKLKGHPLEGYIEGHPLEGYIESP